MQETRFLNANDLYDPTDVSPRPPVWEIQGHGTVAPALPGSPDHPNAPHPAERPALQGLLGLPDLSLGPLDAPEPSSAAAPALPAAPGAPVVSAWFDIRLTFADGARLDVLAVVEAGRIAIEEVRADPPLPLRGLALLAGRIEPSIEEACRSTIAPAPGPAPAFVAASPPEVAPAPPQALPAPLEPAPESASAPAPEPVPADSAPVPPTPAPAPGPDDSAQPSGTPSGPTPDGAARRTAPGHRRTTRAAPRGRAGRRIAADAYRAAQRAGADPVLAVMSATGRSRRTSLRLIAGARDEGFLTPRHRH